MKAKEAILLLDPDAQEGEEARQILSAYFDCLLVNTVEDAHAALTREAVPSVIVRERAATLDGVAFCRAVHRRHPESKIILICSETGHERLIDAFNESCLFRGLIEPVTPDALLRAIRDAIRRFEMDRIQSLLIERAEEIDQQIRTPSYWIYRLQRSFSALTRLIAGSVGLCIVAGMILLLAGLGGFLLLYYIKSALGFDFFCDKHLKDFISP
jgi:DNA-binding NtrC family response regulator